MPDRSFSADAYRFGFNGKENDREYGSQLVQDYGFRIYNPSIRKFLSVDPLSPNYPFYTPYQFAGNKPIWAVDLDGLEEEETNRGGDDQNTTGSNTDPDYVPPPEVTGNEVKGGLSPDGRYFFSGNGDTRQGKWLPVPTQEELDKTKQQIIQGIAEARRQGGRHAADNLQYWLDGKGGVKIEDSGWLRVVPVVQEQIKINEDRFYNKVNSDGFSINVIAVNMKNGESVEFSDYWVAQIVSDYMSFDENNKDFFYAWGAATLTTKGSFTLTRSGDVVKVTGMITHEFYDNYNWEPGLSVPIGDEYVSDEQLIPLEVYDKARPFEGKSTWTIDVNKLLRPKWFLHKK